MSFKKFMSDLSTAAQKAAAGSIAGVLSVTPGDSDGEVVVKYRHESLSSDVRLQALAQNVAEYPDGNMFMLWTDDDNPPRPVEAAIKAAQDYLVGISVYEMVTELAKRLEKEISGLADGEDESLTDADEEDDYDAAYDADYPSDGDEFGLPSSVPHYTHPSSGLTPDQKIVLQRIRRDLRQVKQAGYKVGFLDPFGQVSITGIVSISIRIEKLALSDEAMEAWDVQPTEYVVLLLRFEKPYDSLERIIAQAAVYTDVKFRIGKCNKYKPSLSQALAAFSESNRPLATPDSDARVDDWDHSGGSFEKLFVSNSLDQFLCESFVSLLKLRETRGIDWDEANEFFRTRIGLVTEDQVLPGVPIAVGSDGRPLGPSTKPERHHILASDHLLEHGRVNERSFPLIAMQFAMRYFVKCTEYCLRCHRRLEKGFEALRPYVCSDPLCLFQYMAMGFGPSIEHEILTEPYVVDLLVSLCYAAIQPYSGQSAWVQASSTTAHKLPIRTLPLGLRLRVPDLSNALGQPLRARVLSNDTRLVFEDEGVKSFGELLSPTKWIAFRKPGQSLACHARILEINSANKSVTVEVMGQSSACWGTGQHVYGPGHIGPAATNPTSPPRAEDDIADVYPYVADFDSLDDNNKGVTMRHILDTLPPILDIEEWLNSHPHSSLRSMDRISPAAASLLQWIVSSNRSCIFQVDRSRAVARRRKASSSATQSSGPRADAGDAGRGRNREHERILGMEGWIQFRFAQGSPDKELRFNRALQEVAARKSIQSDPTIFAWHGSHLANWHSIVRTGLDFKEIRCGRAYGNGVYFSPQFTTSIGYSSGGQAWPNSDLAVTSCLSLNEIINAPDEFVSRSPHYVVSQLDWQQCRYLFVQPQFVKAMADALPVTKTKPGNGADGQAFYPQPLGFEVCGKDGKFLQIPLSAVPLRAIGFGASTQPSPSKRTVERLEDSDDEDAGDVTILFTDDEFHAAPSPPTKKSVSRASSVAQESPHGGTTTGPPTPASIGIDKFLTDFEPGALDLSSLPRLDPPSFATDPATKALSRELSRLQNLQAKTPLHELGWYMDFDQVTNLFQWIVELHSFDPSLPLAQDMKRAGVASVVLELRFAGDYPFSPPFVRVVRPRFLPFMEGGGGHVTAGGAMCMELLTSSGWSPANSMESVFLQVRMAMCSLEPKPARLDVRMVEAVGSKKGGEKQQKLQDYGVGEAVEAFMRAARSHGWAVPEGLRVTAFGV